MFSTVLSPLLALQAAPLQGISLEDVTSMVPMGPTRTVITVNGNEHEIPLPHDELQKMLSLVRESPAVTLPKKRLPVSPPRDQGSEPTFKLIHHPTRTVEREAIAVPKALSPSKSRSTPELMAGNATKYRFVSQVKASITSGGVPKLIEEGSGGTWLISGPGGQSIAVFKPRDEEPYAENNPKEVIERQSTPLTRAVRGGEGYIREVAAYLLDAASGSHARVPETVICEIRNTVFQPNKKVGSLQKFVRHKGAAWDTGASTFRERDVHFIGCLDIRTFNLDRHGGNMLVADGGKADRLIPIDHAYILPSAPLLFNLAKSCLWFEWMNYPQARIPFSEDVKRFVSELNAEKDACILWDLGFGQECVLTLHIGTMLLKKAVKLGFTLYDIGTFVCGNHMMLSSCLTTAGEHSDTLDTFISVLSDHLDEYLNRFWASKSPQ